MQFACTNICYNHLHISLPDELEVYTKKLAAKNKKSNNARGKVRSIDDKCHRLMFGWYWGYELQQRLFVFVHMMCSFYCNDTHHEKLNWGMY